MKRAFTLIELLVVIAIIAVLAAILFPVFASAKAAAKKTATLSNIKQSAAAVLLYEGDNDDGLPSAFSIDDGAGCYGLGSGVILWEVGWWATIPAGADSPTCAGADSQQWTNSTQPYRKSYAATTVEGAPIRDPYPADYVATFVGKPEIGSFTMNGLLSTFGASGILSSARVPLLWPGMYNARSRAGVAANPILFCDGIAGAACRFNPGGPPMAGGSGAVGERGDGFLGSVWGDASDTAWVSGRGMTMAYCDGHAAFVAVNPSGASVSPGYKHPFHSFLPNAVPDTSHAPVRCSTPGGPRYISVFRPDLDQETWPLNDGATNACQP